MGTLGWILTLSGTVLGFLLGYVLGRLKLLFTFDSSDYDCNSRTITVNLTDGADLHRVYAVASNAGPDLNTNPPMGAPEKDHDGSDTVTIDSSSWPSSGMVSYTVWGVTFRNISGTKNCDGSGSGSSSFIKELWFRPTLKVTIPDGPLEGMHTAKPVDDANWQMIIDGTTYEIICDSVDSLTIRKQQTSARSLSISTEPFSATFPGALLQATGEVLVTKE